MTSAHEAKRIAMQKLYENLIEADRNVINTKTSELIAELHLMIQNSAREGMFQCSVTCNLNQKYAFIVTQYLKDVFQCLNYKFTFCIDQSVESLDISIVTYNICWI